MVNRAAIITGTSSGNSNSGIISNVPGGQILINQQILRMQNSPVQGVVNRPATVQALTRGQNIIITQPGMRPGTPGSQISVPLSTLQGLQPGQGIPTGQAGHLLVKNENGQCQILRVGTGSLPGTSSISGTLPNTSTSQAQVSLGGLNSQPLRSLSAPRIITHSSTPITGQSTSTLLTSNTNSQALITSSNSGMGQQMTPDTAKHKCKNFLATLLRLASDQPPDVASNVRLLIQGLVQGKIEPEVFTTKLQGELNSSPQPCLVPFLKKSLPHLQKSLRSGELSIEGINNPLNANNALGIVRLRGSTVNHASPHIIRTLQRPSVNRVTAVSTPSTTVRSSLPGLLPVTLSSRSPMQVAHSSISPPKSLSAVKQKSIGISIPTKAPLNTNKLFKKEKISSFSGDDDINDVAAMGGVNLMEESQKMQNTSEIIGNQTQSCKDIAFLTSGNLESRIIKICKTKELEEPLKEVINMISHATQNRLKTLLEKLSLISEHRMDIIKLEGVSYKQNRDVKGQLKFLSELDKIEKKRHEEFEREILLKAVKSRTKSEDPEKEKLKAKAKELQRIEEEQLRHEKANNTALMAIGGPRKKMKFDDQIPSHNKYGTLALSKPRYKRVNMRDVIFLLESEKSLRRSKLIWKAFIN